MPIMLVMKPALTISIIFSFPEPNTTAFGGVATGNIKAKDAAMVIGITRKRGLILMAFESPAITGRSISVVAVFEVNSVRKVMILVTESTKAKAGRFAVSLSCSPM